MKTLWSQWDRLELCDGILYRKWESDVNRDFKLQLIIPRDKRKEVLRYCHDIPTASHLGVEKTVAKVKEILYWPCMKELIENYRRECDRCFARKPRKEHIRAPLITYQAGEPMERISMGILGPLPLTRHQNRYILAIMDTFTKWTEAIAIPSQDTTIVANALIDNFIWTLGRHCSFIQTKDPTLNLSYFGRLVICLVSTKLELQVTGHSQMGPWKDIIEH